jgi:acyl-CoA synthetase (AMP-forming)/AMP-acid ligase II
VTAIDTAATAAQELGPSSLLAAFEARAQADPDDPFASTLDGGSWTYGELGEHAAELATVIGGAPRSSTIGSYGGNDPLSLVAILAAWKSRLCLACCGRQVPPEAAWRLFEMEKCETVLAVDTEPFAGGPWDTIRVAPQRSRAEFKPSGRESRGPVGTTVGPRPDDPACVSFTSGTTGRPKGIRLTHRHLVEQVVRMAAAPGRPSSFRPALSQGRPLISFSPYGHSGFCSWLGFALWLGRGLVLVDKFSVEAAREAVARFSPNTLALTPTMIQMLATAPGDVSLAGVKYVTSSAAPLAPDIKELFSERFGVPVLQAYGMTELGNVAKERLEDVLAGRQPHGSVGRVSPGREVRIVGDDGSPAAEGEEGSILVRATGSSGAPSGAAVDDEGWFDPGDRGAFTPDGILTITGRSTDRIIVGGFNVSPAEVETELRRSELVVDAVVVGIPDARLGEVPVAGIVWSGEEMEEELIGAVRDILAHYKLPRRLFSLGEIPRTVYGKTDRGKAADVARRLLGVDER